MKYTLSPLLFLLVGICATPLSAQERDSFPKKIDILRSKNLHSFYMARKSPQTDKCHLAQRIITLSVATYPKAHPMKGLPLQRLSLHITEDYLADKLSLTLRMLHRDTTAYFPESQTTEVIRLTERCIPLTPPYTAAPFYMALKTNLLYDALLIPNLGAEFHLGRNWSLSGNWMYAWWSNRHHHRYWRTYGGDFALRKWLSERSRTNPLTGHHVGISGQLLTYDFELGGRGYLADRWNYAIGLEYGYSLPVARRLNLNFVIGIGYGGGTYKEYLPRNGCYIRQCTKHRHWIGPTKAEISLVWLIGRGNTNQLKRDRK